MRLPRLQMTVQDMRVASVDLCLAKSLKETLNELEFDFRTRLQVAHFLSRDRETALYWSGMRCCRGFPLFLFP